MATRPCSVLVLDADALRQCVDASSPKFVFAVLRALVGALPAPRQAGGPQIKRAASVVSDDDSDEDAASSVSRGAPSPLEKVLLLRDTKMLRFVPARFLPLLADVAEVEVLQAKKKIASRGGPTDASLRILADGAVVLDSGNNNTALLDGPAASFGNTGLLADSEWPYDARAGNDGAVLLVLRRTRLHDALRGRRDLAAAVARGFLQTYGRRALAAFGRAPQEPISPRGRRMSMDYMPMGSQSPGAAAPLEVSFGQVAPPMPRLV